MAHVQTNHPKLGSDTYTVHWRDSGRFRQRTFTKRREAERFGLRVEDEVAQGRSTTPYTSRGKTVADVIALSVAASAPGLKPRTVLSYQQGYARHVLPALGGKRIAALTSADVELWVADLHASGLAPATVRNTFVALNKVCRYAVRHRYIAQNPCAGTILPTSVKYEAATLTAPEVEAVAAYLDAEYPDAAYGLLVRTAAYTGLRAAELAGLRIRDVNLLRQEIRVARTLQRRDGVWHSGTPKSARSTRTVPILHAPLVAGLVAHIAAHPHRTDPEAALWPGRAPGTHAVDYSRPWDSSNWQRWYFKPALVGCGLRVVRLHDLRHTYASLMWAAGVDLSVVSRWLGHANVATTDAIYAHLYRHDHASERERFAAYMAGVAAVAASESAPTPLRRPLQGS